LNGPQAGVSRVRGPFSFLGFGQRDEEGTHHEGDDMKLNRMTSASRAPRTPQEVNRLNREFWLLQSAQRDRRMLDEVLVEIAMMNMHSVALMVPIKSQKSFELALADAEKLKNTFQSAFSRKGGKTPKCDALQNLIREIVLEKPKITREQLLRELKSNRVAGVISEIDEQSVVKADEPQMIHFVEDDGTPKIAPVSGLKDRLSRAKKHSR
jgi:hypothetical protein